MKNNRPTISIYPLPGIDWITYFAGTNYSKQSKCILTDDLLNPDLDCLFVFDSLPSTISTAAQNTIFLSGETAWTYDDVSQSFFLDFYNQFDKVYTPLPIYLDNVISDYPFLAPMLGGSHSDYMHNPYCSYDHLTKLPPPPKVAKPMISVFQSLQKWKEGHRRRHDLISYLHQRFGNNIDIFGSLHKPSSSKYDALHKYKYHICIENQISPFVVTEKLLDPLLAYTLPIYSGGTPPNPFEKAFLPLDISSYETISTTIETVLDTDPYDHHFEAICRSRQAVLSGFNVFNRIESIALKHTTTSRASPEAKSLRTLHPLSIFHQRHEQKKPIKSRLKNLFFK